MIIFAKSSLTNNDSKSSNEEECAYGKGPIGEKHLRLEYDRYNPDGSKLGRNHFKYIGCLKGYLRQGPNT